MNPPTPTDHEIETRLRGALLADAERITPDPALHQILARAHEGERPRTERRRRWWPVLAGAVATAGVAAAAVVVFAPDPDKTTPAEPVPCAVEVREGCPVDLAIYFQNQNDQLISGEFAVTSDGNVGVDAVQALLTEQPGRLGNPWPGLAGEPVAQVNDVTHDGGVVTVDFDRQLHASASMEGDGSPFGELTVQQLVLTVQSALRTDDPILITVKGEPADEAFGLRLPGPVQADWSLVAGIRPETPTQGDTVSSPVTVSGQSSTLEANMRWSITQAGEPVDEGFTSGGSFDAYRQYSFPVNLEPGRYTLKLWEPNAASGAEAWTEDLSVIYIDFTVE